MMVRAVVPPTVPEGTERVRVCLHAGNTEEEIRTLVTYLQGWVGERMRTRMVDVSEGKSKEVAEEDMKVNKLVINARL